MHSMALTNQQLWVATKIDTTMQKLIRAGKDNMAIMAAMAYYMPAFHQLLSTAQPADMEQLTWKFPGFYRYAKILEALATGIQSDAIPAPGRKETPQQTEQATGHRGNGSGAGPPRAPTGRGRSSSFGDHRSETPRGYVVDLG